MEGRQGDPNGSRQSHTFLRMYVQLEVFLRSPINWLFFCPLAIAIHRPDDVRPILKAYQGKDVALEYAKFEAEMKRKQIEQWEKSGGGKSIVSNAGGSWLFRLMGGVRSLPPCVLPVINNAMLTCILTFYIDSRATRRLQRRKMVRH